MLYSNTVAQTGLPAHHSELCPSFLSAGTGVRLDVGLGELTPARSVVEQTPQGNREFYFPQTPVQTLPMPLGTHLP